MTPEKTGAYIFLEEYGEYVVGDLYDRGRVVLKATRSSPRSYRPERTVVHGVCSRIDGRWEFPNDGKDVIFLGDFLYYGYDGLDINIFLKARADGTPLGRLLDT